MFNDVDCVLTTREADKMIREAGVSTSQTCPTRISTSRRVNRPARHLLRGNRWRPWKLRWYSV